MRGMGQCKALPAAAIANSAVAVSTWRPLKRRVTACAKKGASPSATRLIHAVMYLLEVVRSFAVSGQVKAFLFVLLRRAQESGHA